MTHENSPIRRSNVAYVLAKLRVRGVDYLLLNAHKKWGDWSLVGGHVEPWDESWKAAAAREVAEEMAPLQYGSEVEVEREVGHREWGPVRSASVGVPTRYEARCYSLRFRAHPRECLSRLPPDEFRWVNLDRVHQDPAVASVVKDADGWLPGGLQGLPLSWDEDLDDLPSLQRSADGHAAHAE